MSQNDFNIANQGFPSFRSDLNSALQALASNSAGASAPATMYAYMWWYDSTTNILKMRNADNDAWISFASFNQTTDTWSLASLVVAGDLTVDTNTLHVDSTNNRVGIGTAAPAHELDVRGTTDPSIRVHATGTAATDDAFFRVSIAGTLANASIRFGDADNTASGLISYNHGSDYMVFQTAAAERVRINSSGNVGIGTTSPTVPLDINGAVRTMATTVAALPAAGTAGSGSRHFVTDATATTFASIVAGGGANGVPVYSDGTNWRIG